MNTKYLNFSIFFIILSFFDIITTQYALSNYPSMREGNVIMALVTSSFLLFVLIKAFGVMVIMGLYRRIQKQSATAAKVGQCIIIFIMLLVVGNNCIQIASAGTTWNIYTPVSLNQPGDSTDTYKFLSTNGSYIQQWGVMDNGSLDASYNKKITAATAILRNGVYDINNNVFFVVDTSKQVSWISGDAGNVNYSLGFYDSGFLGCAIDGNCNPVHLMGTLTSLNTQIPMFVSSIGDLYIADGTTIKRYVRATDFAQTTFLTADDYDTGWDHTGCLWTTDEDYAEIDDIAFDPDGNMHVYIGRKATCHRHDVGGITITQSPSHVVYSGLSTTKLLIQKNFETQSNSCAGACTVTSSSLHGFIMTNATGNITGNFSYIHLDDDGAVYARFWNGTYFYDICATSCTGITDLDGVGTLNDDYIYMASSSQNKLYRFATVYSLYYGVAEVESTDVPDITYTTKSINSLYANYYNTSKFAIQAKILFDSGNYPLGVNYGINDQAYRWQIKLIDPNGVTVNSWDTGECDDSGITHCELNINREYNAPPGGWQAGNWYVKLYEHKIDTTLFGDAPMGNLALLTTSATWNVYNGSMNDNVSIITDPTEPITSESNQATISQLDGYVGLMGFGINSVSKFLFSLGWVVIAFAVGLLVSKGSGNIGLALSTLPYTFFTYINYIPKWVFIIYIIMLIIIARVFR